MTGWASYEARLVEWGEYTAYFERIRAGTDYSDYYESCDCAHLFEHEAQLKGACIDETIHTTRGGPMPALKNLDDLFVHTLCRVYDAERRLASILPKMAKAAEARELKQAFESHLKETAMHVERIEELFGMFDRQPNADTNDALRGIFKAGEDTIKLDAGNSVKDAALIVAAQEAEHFEIAAYGTLRTWAQVLKKPDAVKLLEKTLEEEKRADRTLTAIAGNLNFQAAAAV